MGVLGWAVALTGGPCGVLERQTWTKTQSEWGNKIRGETQIPGERALLAAGTTAWDARQKHAYVLKRGNGWRGVSQRECGRTAGLGKKQVKIMHSLVRFIKEVSFYFEWDRETWRVFGRGIMNSDFLFSKGLFWLLSSE